MSVLQVNGYVVCEGVLLFGKADLYVCEGFNLTPSGDVCCGRHQHSRDFCLSAYLSISLPLCLSVCLSVCVSVSLSLSVAVLQYISRFHSLSDLLRVKTTLQSLKHHPSPDSTLSSLVCIYLLLPVLCGLVFPPPHRPPHTHTHTHPLPPTLPPTLPVKANSPSCSRRLNQ